MPSQDQHSDHQSQQNDDSPEISIDMDPNIKSWADIKFNGKAVDMYRTEYIEGEGDMSFLSSSSESQG